MQFLTRLFRALWSINPVWGATASLTIAILLISASFPLNLAFVSYEMDGGSTKQVGFLPSLNWSVVLVFLFPVAHFAALKTVRVLAATIRALPHAKMLARPDWSPAGPDEANAIIDEVWKSAAPIGLFFFTAGLLFGAWDFAVVVAGPLLEGRLPIAPGAPDFYHELDWSVAALFGSISTDPLPGRTANLVFSACAYLILIPQMAFLFSFFGFLVGLSAVLYRISEGEDRVLLLPDAASEDRRRGFQRFSDFFMGVLIVSVCAYICCFLMRIQNLFLRTADYHRIDQMIFGEISSELTEDFTLPHDPGSLLAFLSRTISDIAGAVFATGDLADTQSYFGIGLLLILIFLVVMTLIVILRSAAAESRQLVARSLASPEAQAAVVQYYGLPPETITRNTSDAGMDEWPLKWPKLNTFIAYMALGIACFFFYRLALVWIAVQIWQLFRRMPQD